MHLAQFATARFFIRGALLSTAIGVMVWLIGDASLGHFRPRALAVDAMTGLTIFLYAFGLIHLASHASPAALERYGVVILAFLLYTAGFLGPLTVGAVTSLLSGTPYVLSPQRVHAAMAIGGVLGLTVGLSVIGWERMRHRLAESVARLKETEFAEREIEYAGAIQKRLLPPSVIETPDYRIAAANLPARFIAGDFYDVFPMGEHLGVAIADVAGKGLGASLITTTVKARLPLIASARSVAGTLDELNAILRRELAPREFVALCYLRFDPAARRVELSNAGCPDPYLIRASGRVETISVAGTRLPLGLRGDIRYSSVELTLEPGDRLMLLTDGLPEAPTGDGTPLGYDRLQELLSSVEGDSPQEWLDELLSASRRLLAAERDDDWTLLVLSVPARVLF